jgi:hypothetical protein
MKKAEILIVFEQKMINRNLYKKQTLKNKRL